MLETRSPEHAPADAAAAAPAGALRLVLDTNVVMAIWHFDDRGLDPLRRLIAAPSTTVLTRPDCVEELRRVLGYRQFELDPDGQARVLSAYLQRALLSTQPEVAERPGLPRCRDRDDQKFLELAWDCAADALVTRDKRVLGLARRLAPRYAILTPEKLPLHPRVAPRWAACQADDTPA